MIFGTRRKLYTFQHRLLITTTSNITIKLNNKLKIKGLPRTVMKIVCEGIDLSDATLKVVKACSSKTTIPVLECIKISAKNDEITLSATDGEISIIKKIKAEVYEEIGRASCRERVWLKV